MPVASLLHILRTIKDRGPISRTDLQRLTDLSWGTITNTTRELLARNLIREQGARATKSGRKPVQLALNPTTHVLIGIEIAPATPQFHSAPSRQSPAHIHALLMNLAGDILWHETVPIAPEESPDAILHRAAECVRSAQHAAPARTVLGVGIALPAPGDPHRAVARPGPLGDWNYAAIQQLLATRLNLPVRVEGHPHCLALAERWFGAATLKAVNGTPASPDAPPSSPPCPPSSPPNISPDTYLCLHLGDTIDLGLIIHGDIFRGATGLAGNFGHVSLDSSGPLCPCGDRGCVESYCTPAAILRFARDAAGAEAPGDPHLRSLGTLDELILQAAAGNPRAIAAFQYFGAHLGIALANLIHLFDPALIVLAGATTAAARFFQPALESQIAVRTQRPAGACPILISQLTQHAPAMGVCAALLQSTFSADASPS